MNDFIMRVVTLESKDQTMQVSKTRTNTSAISISMKVGATQFDFSGDNCERRVGEFIDMMKAIHAHPCTLPTVQAETKDAG